MMNIIFMSPHCDPQAMVGEPDSGGQCIYEHELAIALSQLPDLKVTTFCRQNFVRPDESIINNSYSIKRLTCGTVAGVIPKEDIEPVLPEFSTQVIEYINQLSPDDVVILHGHYWDGAYTSLRVKAFADRKLPFIWTPHSLGSTKQRKFVGAEEELHYHFIPRRTWEAYGSTISDNVILSSEKEKQSIISDYAVPESQITVIAPGINLDQFTHIHQHEAREALGLPKTGKMLLCLGRMSRAKGYHHAIEALAELQKMYHLDVFLTIFGISEKTPTTEEQRYVSEMKNLAETLGVSDKVLFKPAVSHDKVNQVFSAADVFLMASEHEPFGLVTIEAMAMKIPVIAANSGGSLNIIQHNQTGILVNFHQPKRVATYILPFLKDEPLYVKIAESAHRYVNHEYSWYEKSGKFAQVYRQVSRQFPEDPFQAHIKNTYFLQQHFGG